VTTIDFIVETAAQMSHRAVLKTVQQAKPVRNFFSFALFQSVLLYFTEFVFTKWYYGRGDACHCDVTTPQKI
jgi:hypothetical protein